MWLPNHWSSDWMSRAKIPSGGDSPPQRRGPEDGEDLCEGILGGDGG